jgi:hypothetical protein
LPEGTCDVNARQRTKLRWPAEIDFDVAQRGSQIAVTQCTRDQDQVAAATVQGRREAGAERMNAQFRTESCRRQTR